MTDSEKLVILEEALRRIARMKDYESWEFREIAEAALKAIK